MSKRFKGSDVKVIVGTTGGPHPEPVVETAANLCRRTGMGLRLVHAVAPAPRGHHYLSEVLDHQGFEDLVVGLRNAAVEEAWDDLTRCRRGITDLASLEANVIEAARPAEALVADALANAGTLIVAGVADSRMRFVPKGLSVALSLMANAPLPVLTVRRGGALDFRKDAYKILIADDLTAASEAAVNSGLSLASALGRTEVVHVHVVDQTLVDLLKGFKGSKGLKAPGHAWESAEEQLHGELRRRAGGLCQLVEASGGRYTTQVVTGHPGSEITAALTQHLPDVAVFGRHHAFHRRPFGIGQVPFSAMLGNCDGVLVAPSL